MFPILTYISSGYSTALDFLDDFAIEMLVLLPLLGVILLHWCAK